MTLGRRDTNRQSNSAVKGKTGQEKAPEWERRISESLKESVKDEGLRNKILKMLRKYSSMWNGNLGELRATEHRIALKPGANPSRQAPYRAGYHARKIIVDQIDSMHRAGMIEPAQAEWASPVVVVAKADGTPRFCVDYRKLNSCTIRDSYTIPRMDDCIDLLGNATVFTTLACN